MKRKHIMQIDPIIDVNPIAYRVVIVTLDSHSAGPCDRAASKLIKDFPGLSVEVYAAAEWGESPDALSRAKLAVASADIIIVNLLFLEEHVKAILPSLEERRIDCDAIGGVISDRAIVKLTRMGELDMSAPDSSAMKLLKKLRGTKRSSIESGERRMKMLRSLPKILKYATLLSKID